MTLVLLWLGHLVDDQGRNIARPQERRRIQAEAAEGTRGPDVEHGHVDLGQVIVIGHVDLVTEQGRALQVG